MNRKLKRSLWCWLALSPLVVAVLFPFAVMFFTSFKPANEVFVYPARWLPVHWRWENYVDMWQAANFGVATTSRTSAPEDCSSAICEATVASVTS